MTLLNECLGVSKLAGAVWQLTEKSVSSGRSKPTPDTNNIRVAKEVQADS